MKKKTKYIVAANGSIYTAPEGHADTKPTGGYLVYRDIPENNARCVFKSDMYLDVKHVVFDSLDEAKAHVKAHLAEHIGELVNKLATM